VNSTVPDLTPSCRNKSIEAIFPEVGQRKVSDVAASLAAALLGRNTKSVSRVDKKSIAKQRDEFIIIFKLLIIKI
jgi:hypothetical protein